MIRIVLTGVFFAAFILVNAQGNVKSTVKKTSNEIGRGAKTVGKEVGKTGKSVGKEIAKTTKSVGKTIKKATK